MDMEKEIRLQKFIALSGKASRRKAEDIISEGRVQVNGKTVNEPGVKINPEKDEVEIDGVLLKIPSKKIYIMLNKPKGYITTVSDQFNRPTVMNLIKNIPYRIYPVGRLDYNTEGLLILTNDGEFANKVIHPRNLIKKVYIAEVAGIPPQKELNKFKNGLNIEGYKTAPAEIKIIGKNKNNCLLEIKIHEGKNRQVRKMCRAIGHPVKELKRVSIGNLHIGELPFVKWRELSENEINKIFN